MKTENSLGQSRSQDRPSKMSAEIRSKENRIPGPPLAGGTDEVPGRNLVEPTSSIKRRPGGFRKKIKIQNSKLFLISFKCPRSPMIPDPQFKRK
jgi:hypothetical protein